MNCPSCDKSDRGGKTCFPEKIVERPILFRLVKIASTIGDETAFPPTVGLYRNVLLNYEANNHSYMYSSDGIPVFLETSIPQSIYDDLNHLQQEIDDLKNSPDVVDIVATYADLQAYDTQHLGDNDIVRVLQDETHGGDSTYYRWDKTNSAWVYIGASPASCTIVYRNNAEPGTTNQHLYKDPAFATAISAGELEDAAGKGLVILMSIDQNDTSNYWTFTLVSVYKDNSGYQFEFLERDVKWEYEATVSTDTVFTRNVTSMLNSSTKFWGQTVNSGEVKGNLTFSGNLSTTGVGFIPGTNSLEMVGGTAAILLSGSTLNDHEVDFNTAQLKGLKDGTENTDAVNLRQLKAAAINVLTSDDYNWSSPGAQSFDTIDPILLSPGVYITDPAGDLQVRGFGNSAMNHVHGALISVSQGSSDSSRQAFLFYNGTIYLGAAAALSDGMVRWTNNSATTDGWMPPTSNVTKGLNDKIDKNTVNGGTTVPTTSTVGSVGTLYSCVNSGTAEVYMCTAVSGSTYTWTKII